MPAAGKIARGEIVSLTMATVVCAAIVTGCATSRAPVAKTPPPQPPPPIPIATGGGLDLEPDSQRAAEARAHWAAGFRALKFDLNRALALKEFEAAAALDPGNFSLQQMVADSYQQLGQWEKAAQVWERAALAQGKSFELWQRAALAYQRAGKSDQAIAAAERARQADPAQTGSYIFLSAIHWQVGNATEALKILDEGVRKNPQSFELAMTLGQTAASGTMKEPKKILDTKKARTALEHAAKLTKAPEQEQAIQLALGNFYARTHVFGKAVEHWLLLSAFPPQTEQQILNAVRDLSDVDKKQIAATWAQAIEKKTEPRHWNLLGEFHELAENYADAAAVFEKSLALDGGQFEIYRALGFAHARAKNADAALAATARAKAKFPEDPQATWFEAMVLVELKRYKEAVAAYAATERLDEYAQKLNRGLFYFQYGAACERAGLYETAETQFQRAIVIGTGPSYPTPPPFLAQSYNYLGYMWADANRKLDEALELIQKALKLDPNNAAFLDSLGWVYFRQGKFAEAVKELQRSVKLMVEEAEKENRKLTPDDAVVFDHIAQAHHKLGQLDEAIKLYQRAVELDPQNKEISQRLQQAQAEKKSGRPTPDGSASNGK